MRTGRRRKTTVIRDKSGKSRGEPSFVHPETLAVRRRELESLGIKPDHALDALAGFTLGLLRLRGRDNPEDPGGISQDQYEAGDAWTRIVHRHAAIMGYKLRIQTPSFAMVGGGSGGGSDADEAEIQRVRSRFRQCYDALAEAGRNDPAGYLISKTTYAVCIDNIQAAYLGKADYGYLRTGLNALARAT
jgi:hypothetical protein